MNERESQISKARRLLSDKRLRAFCFALEEHDRGSIIAVELICEALRQGKSWNELFYDGDQFGYQLSCKKVSPSTFLVNFGCQAGPTAGDGGEWEVSFLGDEVRFIKRVKTWWS